MTHNNPEIEVIDFNNRQLSNTSRYRHVRHLLNKGRAVIVCRSPFTIKLLYTVDSSKTNKTLERARIKEEIKEKVNYAQYILKYKSNKYIADATITAIYTLPAKDREFYYTEKTLEYFTQIYQEQTSTHQIFSYIPYMIKVVQNHNESRKAAPDKVQPIRNTRKNKFANFDQREWDCDELKRLTCDTYNAEDNVTEHTMYTLKDQISEQNLRKNKFANFDQREWDCDELKRLTCDYDD